MNEGSDSPQMRRWTEQRWLLDNVIRANGADWDQPRLSSLNAALGPQSTADIAALRQRIQKYADIAPAFEAVARRREKKAIADEEAGDTIGARENYYMAANYWASAQWPIDETSEQNLSYNARKRFCFEKYAGLADHRVEPAWIALGDHKLPAWFHLPPGYSGGRIPVVASIPGMDGFKERSIALYGDPWLNRGIAVLAVEGPGQYEARLLGAKVSMSAWAAAGSALFDWLKARPEVDGERIGISGRSFGSFFATIAAANEARFKCCAVAAVCLEPGCHTIFEEASPTFKKRFMWMSGYTDEAAFDVFCKTLTWQGHAEKIRRPYLAITGGADELSPLVHTEALMRTVAGPKMLVIYQDARHALAPTPSVNLGPAPNALLCEWTKSRFSDQAFGSERWFVDGTGIVNKTSL